MRIRSDKTAVIAAVIAAGILARAYAAFVIRPASGDSAVFALMAKHILELKEFYIYMPLAHYAGALFSYAGAALFALFGVSYNSWIAVSVISSSLGLIIGCIISHKILDGFGSIVSDILIALPGAGMIYYSLFIGVHAENFLFIPILLLLAIKVNRGEYRSRTVFIALTGLLSGVTLWSTPGAIPAILTIATLILIRNRGRSFVGAAVPFLCGIMAGFAPAIIYDLKYPGATLFRMAGRVFDLDRSALADPQLLYLVARKLCWRLSTIPGSLARIPGLTAELISYPAAIILFVSIAALVIRALRRPSANRRVDDIGVILVYVLWFILFYAAFVGESAGRYMVPLAIAAPFLIGKAFSVFSRPSPVTFGGGQLSAPRQARHGEQRRTMSRWSFKNKGERLMLVFLASTVIIYNAGTIISRPSVACVPRYAKLTGWLAGNNALRGYSDYDTAYMVRFESSEKAGISPTLFHPTFCDRFPEETKMVRSADDVCYIIDSGLYPYAAEIFERSLRGLGLRYSKDTIDDFAVYRGIPPELEPKDIITGMPAQGRR